MKRNVLCVFVLTLVFAASATLASAQTPPVFQLGFKALADQLPASVVGVPTENEHFNLSNGNSEQHTTTGLMVWRKADNWTAYTNGYMTWVNGPTGVVQSRLNTERFGWESDGRPAPPAAPGPAPTGYRYFYPWAIDSDTATYVGQKVALLGVVRNVVHYNYSYTWIDFIAWGVKPNDPTGLIVSTDLVVRFYPMQGAILKGHTIKVYGTITHMENVILDLFGAPITLSTVIIGDYWEPW